MNSFNFKLLASHHKKNLTVKNTPYGHCSTNNFFPNYMMHTVYPFKNTNEERRSISFNAKVDEHVYNVYANRN